MDGMERGRKGLHYKLQEAVSEFNVQQLAASINSAGLTASLLIEALELGLTYV